jgi:hypothetical protein
MRIFPRATLVVLLLLGPVAGTAMAVTMAQLVELAKAGLSDEVLIALIETDGSTFQLSAADILQLHRTGLSNGVILAMQKAGQNNVRAVRPTEAQAVLAPGAEPAPIVQEQVVQPAGPTPSVINVVQTVAQRVTTSPAIVPAVPFAVPIFLRPQVNDRDRPAPPQYWGWNGQRRPDTWQETPRPDPTMTTPGTPVKKSGGS